MKVGLIGAGLQGWRRARAVKEFTDTELVVLADIDKDAASLLANEMRCEATDNWEDVVSRKDIEVILVCTPNNLHALMSIAALKEGKHVLCEKPLARNPDEAKKMVDTALEYGVRLKCGFNLRYHPGISQAREWFERGMMGEMNFIRCRYGIGGRPGYDEEWRTEKETAGGGELLDQGIHVIDLFRWFMGDFSEVVGFISTSFWDIAPLEDNAFTLFRTKKQQIASLHASWTQWKNLFSFEMYGYDGYITVEGLGGSYGTERAILGTRSFLKPLKEEVVEFRGKDCSWLEEWKEFVTALKENREPMGNGYEGWQALKLAYAAYESARRHCVVKL